MEVALIPIKQLFFNPDNEYRVLSCIPENWNTNIELNNYGNFTLSGSNLSGLVLNQTVTLDISQDINSKYPASYIVNGYAGIKFEGNITVDPKHELMLLQQIMTKEQAKNVNNAYPNFIQLVLNNEQDKIDINNIYNVGEFRFNDYCNKIKENFAVFMFLAKAKEYNLTDFNVVSKLCFAYNNTEKWEQDYKEHPYVMLSEKTDWTFNKIDKTVLSALPEFNESKERAQYCIYDYLKANELDGDTKIKAKILKAIITEEYPELAKYVVDIVLNDEQIYYDKSSKYCGFMNTYKSEQIIADNIMQRINFPQRDTMDWAQFKNIDGFVMTDEQNTICQIANDESIGMMIGCAGTGKTTATKALIKMLESYNKSYILLAPTGIAAKKLKESTHRMAYTIHMALAQDKFITEEYDYIIIDEMSCVGVNLLATVLKSVPNTTKIILICDNAQLASIACGNIVENIIDSDIIPTAKLTRIFRYGTSGITTIATNTRNGNFSGRENSKYSDNDYKYIEIENRNPISQIVTEYNNLLLDGYNRNNILILCPFNKTTLGTYVINEAIQQNFNTNQKELVIKVKNRPVSEIHFKVGDRVINTLNNYHVSVVDIDETGDYIDSGMETGIMNGDIGIIRDIEILDTTYNVYIQFDECIVKFTPKETAHLLLGYCISIHKCQGTSAKAIITVIGKNHKHMVTRNLLYVAVSRAENKLVEIVDKDCVLGGLDKVETIDRATWLKELLSCNMPEN